MPTQEGTPEQVKAKRVAAADYNREAVGMEAASTTLYDNVMDAVRKDRAERGVSQMATETGNVMGQMVTEPEAIRGRLGDMVRPNRVDYWTSQERAAELEDLGTLSTQMKLNEGSIEDVIQAGANQLKARAAMKLAEAQRENAEADAILEQLGYELELRKQEFSEMDANRKFAASGRGTGGMGTRDKEFQAYAEVGRERLMNGESWEIVWPWMKQVFPEYSNEDIDIALGGSAGGYTGNLVQLPAGDGTYREVREEKDATGWAKPGAYEDYKDKTSKDSGLSWDEQVQIVMNSFGVERKEAEAWLLMNQ